MPSQNAITKSQTKLAILTVINICQMQYFNKMVLLILYSNNLQQLQCKRCKSKKLHKLISNKKSNQKKDSDTFLVINLSSEDLDTKPLKYCLHHSFDNKISM